ncbi:hypothetical protein, partial [Bacteroides nordii]|uniref:hypothetical protein n=1 Tax=Bacteroides nordii TaxID=291645 RepID=UPI001E33D475
WQNPEQLFVAQELINKVKSKCCGIKDIHILDLRKLGFNILSLVNAIYCNSSIFIFFYSMHDNFILLLNKSTRKR